MINLCHKNLSVIALFFKCSGNIITIDLFFTPIVNETNGVITLDFPLPIIK